MSKKKRIAKLQKRHERAAMLERRATDALVEFSRRFPSPYASQEEAEADRELRKSTIAAECPREGRDYTPSVIHADGLFEPWVLRFRDAVVAKASSPLLADARVRFQLADHVLQTERDRGDDVRVDHISLLRTAIAKQPFEWSSNTPYTSAAEADADLAILHEAWRQHFKLAKLPADFMPSLFDVDEGGPVGAPWMAVFRNLLIEKYGSLDAAEPRWRFTVSSLSREFAGRVLDGVPPSDELPGSARLESASD